MKKILFLIMISIISFFGIKDVKADDEIYLDYETNINEIQSFIDNVGYEKLNIQINGLIDYYKENYSSVYPYYHIGIQSDHIYLQAFYEFRYDELFEDQFVGVYYKQWECRIITSYDYLTDSFSDFSKIDGYTLYPIFYFEGSQYFPYDYYYSNYDLYFYIPNDSFNSFSFLSPNDIFYVRSLKDPSIYSVHQANSYFLIEPYYLYDKNSNLEPDNDRYITIDLNNYPYVALSLKDYSVESFDTVMYVKGQLCPSGIYNYGMLSKEDYKNGYQVTDRCNIAYDNFTPTKFYVLDGDLENHAIWYLKAFDTSIENKIKVDSSIFNIHYITEEEKDNPILNINGKNYTTIPYDELPSTATKNEEENYVPGASEEFTFEGFFDKPLDALKSVWSAIVSVFAIITEFILLLPPTMQAFLYTSFGIAIVLGIIKILL